jgi:hypothetical protein
MVMFFIHHCDMYCDFCSPFTFELVWNQFNPLDYDILHYFGSKNYKVPNVGEPHGPKIQRSV